jgi:hypothetical protein
VIVGEAIAVFEGRQSRPGPGLEDEKLHTSLVVKNPLSIPVVGSAAGQLEQERA